MMGQEVGCISIVKIKNLKRARTGLSLIELVVVLIIVAIVLIGFGSSASVQVKRASRSDVENELNVMASNLSDAYYDLGNPAFNPAVPDDAKRFKKFLATVGTEYMGCVFDTGDLNSWLSGDDGTLKATANGFSVEIKEPLDAYEQTYKCWFVTVDNLSRYCMICSGGDNTIVEQTGYASGNYADDIVLVVYPKVGEATTPP